MAELPIVVLGAGGHAKVVADILMLQKQHVIGFLDPRVPVGSVVLGLPVLGGDDWLAINRANVALGIGDNSLRERLATQALQHGSQLFSAIHPRAVVASSARIQDGVVIAALAVVNPDATVERGAIVNTGAVVEHDCVIGAFAHLATNATTGGGCNVGRRSLLGSGATMLPGTSVGDGSVIGSHALVSRDVAGRSLARGVPARVTRLLGE